MKDLKITSIGEILFDIYPRYKRIGGAPFNFIYHVWKLTGSGKFISRIGADPLGAEILTFLKQSKFDVSAIQMDNKHHTGTVDVVLDENKTPSFTITPDAAYDNIELNDTAQNIVSNETDLLYFGTLAQRSKVTRSTIQSLWRQNKKFFCDINLRQNFYNKELLEECLRASNVVKLNINEFNFVSELEKIISDNFVRSAKRLAGNYNIELLCITMGEDGAILIKGNTISEYKSIPAKLVDTVGAGDAFSAMLAIGYILDWNIEKTVKLASEFAAEICTVIGALPEDDNIYNKYLERINND